MNPSGLTDSDKEEIDQILGSLIEDIKEMRDAEWDDGKYGLTISKDAEVYPKWHREMMSGFLEGPVVTSFELKLPSGTWEVSHKEP